MRQRLSRCLLSLKNHIEIADDDIETAQFGAGVMVLPVAYTKGLEFDAVLLFDPSERKYPADDSHVKLLYVAATRALHELAVFHRGQADTAYCRTSSFPQSSEGVFCRAAY